MSPAAKEGVATSATLDDALAEQFDALSSDVDAEAISDAATSVHAWKERVEKDRLESQVEHLKAKYEAKRADIALRTKYAEKAFELASWAVWFWMVMFAATAITNTAMGKPALSDKALITLTSGATINVIAICMVVVRGLFPTKNKCQGKGCQEKGG